MSTVDTTLPSPIRPFYTPVESATIRDLITKLQLRQHPEGGYFVETDRDPYRVPNPFKSSTGIFEDDDLTRSASTSIYYLLTPASPTGHFHTNKARTVHTLHRGRGRYVVIHPDEKDEGGKARIETFVVGLNVQRGERPQWIVEGGKYKASFLLPDEDWQPQSDGLLISEVQASPSIRRLLYCLQYLILLLQTVIPGFEFTDHAFMRSETLAELVTGHQADELRWLLLEENR